MRNVKPEPISGTEFFPMAHPTRTNFQKAVVEDVAMADAGSSFASANMIPVFSDTDTNSASTPLSDASLNHQGIFLSNARNHQANEPSQETGLQIVGRRVQVLVDAINDIRGMGVDYLVDLPQLVLVGDQSAGKSSLMGALAEIHLPQDSKCCTRCPTHIKTGSAETWSCKISLYLTYSYDPQSNGRAIKASDVTSKNLFPPWKEMELVTKEFMVIRDKSQLEQALKWAQIAILNPSKSHKLYVPDSRNILFVNNEDIEAKFSPNVVSVEMSGPALPPLSFFDLPGIFQNPSQKEDRYLVSVVENLAKKYIRHEQSLVISALPMSADPATSRTGRVIIDLKAEGRTIGVLTKADCLQLGHSGLQFEELLQGQTHQVGHGYYVTKQPALSSRANYDGDYHAKARKDEEVFFDTEQPWASEWRGFRNRCGTENLQHALSQKFAAQIVKSIPKIEATVNQRSQKIEAELAKLPELPTNNVSQIVLQELTRFTQQMQALMDGANPKLHSAWSMLNGQLYDAIVEHMHPIFLVRDPSDLAVASQQMEIDGLEIITLDDESPVANRSVLGTPARPPVFRAKEESGLGSPQRPKRHVNGAEKSHSNAVEAPNPFISSFFQGNRLIISIGDIRRTLATYSKPGAPGHIDFRAKDELCMRSVKVWESPIEKYIDLVLEMVRQQAQEILDQYLCKWRQTQLYKQGFNYLGEFFDGFEGRMRKTCAEILSLETYKFFTINKRSFDQYGETELKKIRDARRKRRATVLAKQQMQGVNTRGDDNAKHNALLQKIKNIKDDELGEDPFKTEIEVAALVRGYYLTAADRFCDQVCLTIHGRLFKQAHDDIFFYLEKKLGLTLGNIEERCRELMEEDATTSERRRSLQQEKEKLQKFTNRLLKLAADDKIVLSTERMDTTEVEMGM